jgi:hypothetical protein
VCVCVCVAPRLNSHFLIESAVGIAGSESAGGGLSSGCVCVGNSNWPLAGDLSCQQLHRTLSKRRNIFQCSPPIKNRELRVEKCVHL